MKSVPIRWRRGAFIAFAGTLFVLTHWPKLEVPGASFRSDLWLHASAFALWTALFIAAACFGPALSRRNITFALPLGIAYAGIDEGLQAVPFVSRHCTLDDFSADVFGVLVTVAVALVLSRYRATRDTPRPD